MPDKYTYLNRDLSWLSFNHRVLMEAADKSVPLYSRIAFLSIFSSNLDEFFRVRMPVIFAFTSIKGKKTTLREEYPKDLVEQVQTVVLQQLEEFGRILTRDIIPELRQHHICLYYGERVKPQHQEIIREYFLSRVLSFLQPVILREDSPGEVFLENNALYLLADIESSEDPPGTHRYALLNIPSAHLPRFLELPVIGDDHHILFIDDVIRENLQEIFPGFIIHGAWSIKLTRDAEMDIGDEFTGDIAEKIEKQLEKRDGGHSTRFLYESGMPETVKSFAKGYFDLRKVEMIEGGRYHNLKDLGNLPDPTNGKLKYVPLTYANHPAFTSRRSIFQVISEKDRALHLPYHSYNYILRFFNEAAIDPNVKEIFVTLYRVAADSHIVNALISAAKNGKKVTVFVELKARFDEANNLRWSKKMKEAGIRIINSIPGLKVHAKVAMIKRQEQKEIRTYSFMATGNFNEATGRFYTDHVYFTANEIVSKELEQLFDYLVSRKQPDEYGRINFNHLMVSQFNMMDRFMQMIDREINHAKDGKPAHVIIKVNNLQERMMIDKLYEAARAGVKVDLLVRSICCLAPGVKHQSENITVKRIIDRYLEHARVFVFYNDGKPEVYMGSADWMNRNLHNRIEVCFPVTDEGILKEIRHIIQLQLDDCKKAVHISKDMGNEKINCKEGRELAAQEAIYQYVKSLE